MLTSARFLDINQEMTRQIVLPLRLRRQRRSLRQSRRLARGELANLWNAPFASRLTKMTQRESFVTEIRNQVCIRALVLLAVGERGRWRGKRQRGARQPKSPWASEDCV
jgi:hypothetical protein